MTRPLPPTNLAQPAGDPAARLEPVDIATAWQLRGDARNAEFVAATERTLNLALPVVPNAGTHAGMGSGPVPIPSRSLLALGPGAWLYVATAAVDARFDDARLAINTSGGALFDVSASYLAWLLSGAHVDRVLNQGCPLDFDARTFPVGSCAQSVLAHVTALFVRCSESAFMVMVPRSFAEGVAHDLATFIQSSTTIHVGA